MKLLLGGLEKHLLWHRIYGHKGCLETSRMDSGQILIHKEPWNKAPGEPADVTYRPEFRQFHELASRTGHGGGDFFMLHEFITAIRTGEPPVLDVTRGLQMSCLGILAHKSALNGSGAIPVPSFTDLAELAPYEGDNWSPDPADAGPGQPWPSVLGDIKKPAKLRAKVARRARELRPDWNL